MDETLNEEGTICAGILFDHIAQAAVAGEKMTVEAKPPTKDALRVRVQTIMDKIAQLQIILQ